MSKPILTYFDLRARAEVSRLILAQAGVEYVDNRVTGDSWKAFKPSESPFLKEILFVFSRDLM